MEIRSSSYLLNLRPIICKSWCLKHISFPITVIWSASKTKQNDYRRAYRDRPRLLILDNHVKNKKYGNFVSISSLTGECAAEQLKNFLSSSLWTCLHHMVILKSQNKITDFFMILAWACPFNVTLYLMITLCGEAAHTLRHDSIHQVQNCWVAFFVIWSWELR